MSWYWISLTSDAGFLGAAIVQASSEAGAVTAALRCFVSRGNIDTGLALRAQAKVTAVPSDFGAPPPRFVGHLLGESECRELRASWIPDTAEPEGSAEEQLS